MVRLAWRPGSRVPNSASRPRAMAPARVPMRRTVAGAIDGWQWATWRMSDNRLRSGEEARESVPRATFTPEARSFSGGCGAWGK